MNVFCTFIIPLLTFVIGLLIPRKGQIQTVVPATEPVKEYGLFLPPGCKDVQLKASSFSTYVNGDYGSITVGADNLTVTFGVPYRNTVESNIKGVVR